MRLSAVTKTLNLLLRLTFSLSPSRGLQLCLIGNQEDIRMKNNLMYMGHMKIKAGHNSQDSEANTSGGRLLDASVGHSHNHCFAKVQLETNKRTSESGYINSRTTRYAEQEMKIVTKDKHRPTIGELGNCYAAIR